MAESANVFTIPAGAPFLPTLADAILSGRLVPLPGGGPLALADLTILVPTRRAARALGLVLARRIGGTAAILPVIRPIGDVDEEDHLLNPAPETDADRLVLPPAISKLERQLALTRLTLAWGRTVRRELLALRDDEPLLIPASAADATRLAADLARLIDDLATAGVDPARLRDIAPADHAQYFQVTLDFLRIVLDQWPLHLADLGRADPAARRDELIRAEAKRLAAGMRRGPVIAAGSTGSIPATAELLRAISRLPDGAVVLPGLDQSLDAAGWAAIGETAATVGHPQYGLKLLLADLGVAREDVAPLAEPPPALAVRARLVAEAMRPAETTERWAAARADLPGEDAVRAALDGVALVAARNEQEEALAIALAVREALEDPKATAAVVTPDRAIARRVAVELGRFGVAVDDSAGQRLDLQPAGIFARLLVEALVSDADPATLLSLLKHPLAAFGMKREDCRRAARFLELGLFRGRRIHGGVAALAPALARIEAETADETARHTPSWRKRLEPENWADAARLVERLREVLGPAETVFAADNDVPVGVLAKAAFDALRNAASAGKLDTTLADDRAGARLSELFLGLQENDDLAMRPAEFAPFLAALMSGVIVSTPAGAEPRVHIWGTLEARLQSADLIILAGLDEKVWPSETRTDPWLSRSMRAEIGLPAPERRIGLSAHDFTEGLSAPRVVITRAEKRAGTPMVASRWLQRLAAFLGEAQQLRLKTRGDAYVLLARDLDREASQDFAPVGRPSPRPPVAVRPRALSVTEIETLIRDPYAVYAKHVLRLHELDPLGMAPDYATRGNIVHEALGAFTQSWAGPFDREAELALLAAGRAALSAIEDFPDVHALWSARFETAARWIVEWEAKRDPEIARRNAEIRGKLILDAPAGPFTLYGRADRIDLRNDGGLEILDFKTGTPPTAKQVLSGFAPQLALEAAMAREGGFDEAYRGLTIAALAWIGLSKVGRAAPLSSAVEGRLTADEVAERALGHLRQLLAAYDSDDRGYASWARPQFETRYESPYDHLARVKEWTIEYSDEDRLAMQRSSAK